MRDQHNTIPFRYKSATVKITRHSTYNTIHSLVSRNLNLGHAKVVARMALDYADARRLSLYLEVGPYGYRDSRMPGFSDLKRLYGRYGFLPSDYPNLMLRHPNTLLDVEKHG